MTSLQARNIPRAAVALTLVLGGACSTMRGGRLSLPLFLLLLADPAPAAAQERLAPAKAVLAGRLIDGRGGPSLADQVILIDGDRIVAVGPRATMRIPAGAQVVDLSRHTVLPGLVDAHTHLTSIPEIATVGDALAISSAARAFRSVEYARRTLMAGFTTVRDVGGNYVDVALRDAIAAGHIVGPRMLVSGPPITMTGGHSDFNDVAPEFAIPTPWATVADGVDGVRRAVRTNQKFGVDLIKIMASGGVGTLNSNPHAAQYTVEELRAAVEEARMSGRRVAAHAHSTQGIKNAVTAGVASIEHGSALDDEAIAMMKQRGVYLVSDLYADEFTEVHGREMKWPEEILAKNTALSRQFRESFSRAHAAGVKIAFGTDAGVYPYGQNARQFALMVQLGMTPMQAIRAATADAAELLGLGDRIGTVEPGKLADLIAVHGDPLLDVRVLEDVKFVMKSGVVFKQRGR